jgi:hypothetical protein
VAARAAAAAREAEGAPALLGGSRETTLLWHRHLDDPIYTSTGICEPAGLACAGTWLNLPRQFEAVPLDGDGTPAWTYPGTEFYADASREGSVLAAINFHTSDSTATIMEWRPGSAVPLWTYAVHPCRSMVYQGWSERKPIAVSDDGSTIAVALVMYTPQGQRGRLFVFDAGSGEPAVDWPFPDGNVVALEITADGATIAMAGWPTLYVFDRQAEALRWSGPIGSGNDALAISDDGRYLAWGWSTFNLREWNGANYATLWTHTPGGGIYVGQCAFASDNGALALSWDNGNTLPSVVWLDLYALPSLDLMWSYNYESLPAARAQDEAYLEGEHPRQHVDIPSQMRFSPDGRFLAVSSWGDDFPELHVFDREQPEPLATLDTPGSMFDTDIVTLPSGAVRVTCCGKAVHAGTSGRGGDFYALEIGEPTAAPATPALRFGLEAAYPNPFNPATTLAFSLPAAGPARLSIHDAAGRLVKRLVTGVLPAGRHEVLWTGRDDRGAPAASGLYLVRLEAGGRMAARKILLAK